MRDLVVALEWRPPESCLCQGRRLVWGRDTTTRERFLTPCPHCTHGGPIRERLENSK